MPRLVFFTRVFAFAMGLGAAATASDALASEAADAPIDAPRGFAFDGRAIYAGGGGGVLPDLHTTSENWTITATFPLARWLALETSGFGFNFQYQTPARTTKDTVALGIGVGLRASLPPDRPVRPYLAARFEHIHMLFDPEVDPSDTDTTSQHRWGLAGAIGVDMRLTRRLRTAVEVGPTIFTGVGTHGGGQAMAMLGFAF